MEVLIVEAEVTADEASVEIDEPRDVGIASVGSSRPVSDHACEAEDRIDAWEPKATIHNCLRFRHANI